MAFRPGLLYALLRIVVWLVVGATAARGQAQSGIAIYFDPTGAVPHLPITCGINDPSLAELSAVAISSAHLNGRIEGCGQCILLSGTGSGIGGVPVSTAPTKYLITHQCTECAPHELELALPGLAGSHDIAAAGKWAVSWSFVECVPEETSEETSASRKILAATSMAKHIPAASELGSALSSESLSSAEWLTPALLDSNLRLKLTSQQVSSHRRLAQASDEDSEALPSAEWLQSVLASPGSENQQKSRQQSVSRRQLVAEESGGISHRRHLSLRALKSMIASEQQSKAQRHDELPAEGHQKSELAFWYPFSSSSSSSERASNNVQSPL